MLHLICTHTNERLIQHSGQCLHVVSVIDSRRLVCKICNAWISSLARRGIHSHDGVLRYIDGLLKNNTFTSPYVSCNIMQIEAQRRLKNDRLVQIQIIALLGGSVLLCLGPCPAYKIDGSYELFDGTIEWSENTNNTEIIMITQAQ